MQLRYAIIILLLLSLLIVHALPPKEDYYSHQLELKTDLNVNSDLQPRETASEEPEKDMIVYDTQRLDTAAEERDTATQRAVFKKSLEESMAKFHLTTFSWIIIYTLAELQRNMREDERTVILLLILLLARAFPPYDCYYSHQIDLETDLNVTSDLQPREIASQEQKKEVILGTASEEQKKEMILGTASSKYLTQLYEISLKMIKIYGSELWWIFVWVLVKLQQNMKGNEYYDAITEHSLLQRIISWTPLAPNFDTNNYFIKQMYHIFIVYAVFEIFLKWHYVKDGNVSTIQMAVLRGGKYLEHYIQTFIEYVLKEKKSISEKTDALTQESGNDQNELKKLKYFKFHIQPLVIFLEMLVQSNFYEALKHLGMKLALAPLFQNGWLLLEFAQKQLATPLQTVANRGYTLLVVLIATVYWFFIIDVVNNHVTSAGDTLDRMTNY